jgi:hypothetical protein
MMKISAVMWQTHRGAAAARHHPKRASLPCKNSTSARTCNPIKRHSVVVVVVAFAKAKRHQMMRLIQ